VTASLDSQPRTGDRLRILAVGLVAVHVLVALVLLFDPSLRGLEYATRSDAARFYEIGTHRGLPYLDFEVEYPPVTVLIASVLALGSFDAFIVGVILVSLACDLLVALLLWRTWGERAGLAYLVLSAPLLALGLVRLDWLPTLLAVVAFVLVLRPRKQLAAGTMLAIATFAKLWPSALIALWIARRQWTAIAAFCVTGALGLAAWTALGGLGSVGQVLTYRGARGWQIESLPGTLVATFTSESMRLESGAWRIGHPPEVLGIVWPLLGFAAVAGTAYVLWRSQARRDPSSDAGTPALAAVCSVLVCATLLSPQFLVWLLPWAAIAFSLNERRAPAFVLAAIMTTVAAGAVWSPQDSDQTGAQVLYWTRNLLLVGAAIAAARSTARPLRVSAPKPM
jgi:hypothetical protein